MNSASGNTRDAGAAPKTIRLFVSSTFRDMHAERDHLSRIVFPELRSRCLRRGAELIAFDLRWGVTEEEAEQQGALAICLEEIERCRPFFLCLLGDRFGWVPPPEDVPRATFDELQGRRMLPPEISEWYRLDETVFPPVYRLRRDRKVPDDVADTLARFWESNHLPLATESITAREIRRAVFEEGHPPSLAFFYLRKPGLQQQAAFPPSFVPVFMEQDTSRCQKLAELKERILTHAGQISIREYETVYAGLRIDPMFLPPGLSADEQEALEDGLIAPDEWSHLSAPVREAFQCHGTVALDRMEDLGQQVLDDLWPAIEADLARPAEPLDAHQRECTWHERFVVDHTRLFLGRAQEIAKVMAYVDHAQHHQPLIVTGEPGAGKSAFIAECVRLCREHCPGALVIPHFIGVAPGSASLSATLRSICETLRRELALEEAVATDPRKLRSQLAGFLEKAGSRRTVVLFLDALNQLDPADRSHELDWLPKSLPPGTKLVVSTAAGDCLDQLERCVIQDHVIEIPDLPDNDRRMIAERFLAARRKKLTSEQLARLLATDQRPAAGLPLYLLVALEELCLFGDHQALSQRIDHLPEQLPELFEQVLVRLESDHGRSTTESICGWLVISRSGLLESEVLDLLGHDGTFPPIRWRRFYRALEPYLKPVEEDAGADHHGPGRLDFYHDQLRSAASRRYLEMPSPDAEVSEACRAAHRQLAGYFGSIAQDAARPGEWCIDRVRGLSELPYHQMRGHLWQELERTLCDLKYIAAKCAAGMSNALVAEDYAQALLLHPDATSTAKRSGSRTAAIDASVRLVIDFAKARTSIPAVCSSVKPLSVGPTGSSRNEKEIGLFSPYERIEAFAEFVTAERGSLAVCSMLPAFCSQQAWNWARSGPVPAAAARLESSGHRFLLPAAARPARRPHPAWVAALQGHTAAATCVALSWNGRAAVSGSEDCVLRVWDVPHGASLFALSGHGRPIRSCDLTPDGQQALSVDAAGEIRLWNVREGQVVRLWKHDQGYNAARTLWKTPYARSIRMTPDARSAVIGCDGGELLLLDLESDRSPQVLQHPSGTDISAVALSADGATALTGGVRQPLTLWDLRAGSCLAELGERNHRIQAIDMTWDGRLAASAGDDHTIRIWDLFEQRKIATLRGHSAAVCSVRLTADGQYVLSGSRDRTLRLWSIPTRSQVRVLEGPDEEITSLALAADGHLALSVGSDESDRHYQDSALRAIKVWDVETGWAPPSLYTHGGDLVESGDIGNLSLANKVVRVAVSPDGRIAATLHERALKVWDVENRALLHGHQNDFAPLADTSFLRVTAKLTVVMAGRGRAKAIQILDTSSGVLLHEVATPGAEIESCAMTADDLYLLALVRAGSSTGSALQLWEVASGRCVRVVENANAWRMALSPSGKRVALFPFGGGSVSVLDLASGASLPCGGGGCGAFSPDERLLAIASGAGSYHAGDGELIPRSRVRMLDVSTDPPVQLWDFVIDTQIQTMAFTRAGNELITWGPRSLRLSETRAGACLLTLDDIYPPIKPLDGPLVLLAGPGNMLSLWDFDSRIRTAALPLPALATDCDAQKETVAIGDTRGNVHFYKLQTQTATVLSPDAEANQVPSDENASDRTQPR